MTSEQIVFEDFVNKFEPDLVHFVRYTRAIMLTKWNERDHSKAQTSFWLSFKADESPFDDMRFALAIDVNVTYHDIHTYALSYNVVFYQETDPGVKSEFFRFKHLPEFNEILTDADVTALVPQAHDLFFKVHEINMN